MAKKNANNAIDFTRLLAVKDQLSAQSPLPISAATEPVADTITDDPILEPTGTLLEFPTREPSVENPGTSSLDQLAHASEAPASTAVLSQSEDVWIGDAETVVLRIGLSRLLHDRVRACAALEGKSPAHLARELLSQRTPAFPRSTPMATLAKQARESFPAKAARSRVDVRMQVPIDRDLHRRLHQLAALRTQTLVACISDLFEASVPGM